MTNGGNVTHHRLDLVRLHGQDDDILHASIRDTADHLDLAGDLLAAVMV